MIIEINSIDLTGQIANLNVEQNITTQINSAEFVYLKAGARTYTPTVMDTVAIYDGATKIFSGRIVKIDETAVSVSGLNYEVNCASDAFELDNLLVSEAYDGQTVKEIIEHMITNYAPTFTTNNVQGAFVVDRMVFNQISVSECLLKLANMLRYEWYVDVDRDIHFITKFSEVAPYNLTDDSGNYVYKSLAREIDGTQIVNRVLVRGGEYDGAVFTDILTVKGNSTTSFDLPYKFSGLTVELDTGAGYVSQSVGIDFINDFTTKDVLYNFHEKIIKWENPLADGDLIRFSGKPKIPVLSVATDSESIVTYGLREKVIRDTAIEDLTTARRRAIAEIDTFADTVQDVKFKTYTAGLRAGMVLTIDSDIRNVSKQFIIKRVSFSPLDKTNFEYSAELVSTKTYELIDVLRKILKVDQQRADPNEIAEVIEVDNAEITVQELIEVMTAVQDFVDIQIIELIDDDPLGAGVEPTWVLGNYFPTGIDDTKRQGLLDYSFKLY